MRLQKMIGKTLPLFLLPIISGAIYAQTVSPVVLGSAGGEAEVGDVTIMWTVGELAVATLSNGEEVVTQGFHQPPEGTTSVSYGTGSVVSVRVRPNPVADELFVGLPDGTAGEVRVELIDMLGQQVLTSTAQPGAAELRLDVGTLPSGVYAVRVLLKEGAQSGLVTIRR